MRIWIPSTGTMILRIHRKPVVEEFIEEEVNVNLGLIEEEVVVNLPMPELGDEVRTIGGQVYHHRLKMWLDIPVYEGGVVIYVPKDSQFVQVKWGIDQYRFHAKGALEITRKRPPRSVSVPSVVVEEEVIVDLSAGKKKGGRPKKVRTT